MLKNQDWSIRIILFGLIFFFFFGIWITSDYNKPNIIQWDGYGYYVYLPEILIYRDSSQYAFAEAHGREYPGSYNGYQLHQVDTLLKRPTYNIGLSIIWAPFFLAAHILTQVLHPDQADGMSTYYQWAIFLCGIFFYFLGMWYVRKWLKTYMPDKIVAGVIFLISFGTNYFYYMNFGKELTHIYLFALLAMFCYFLDCYQRENIQRYLIFSALVFGLAILIRSSEVLWIIFPALYGVIIQNRHQWISEWKKNVKSSLFVFALGISMYILIQMGYDYITTGHWLIDGYSDHSFDFWHPHIARQLIGINRGWFTYSPILALAVLGFYAMYVNRQKWLMAMLVYLIAYIWLISSWDDWTYGSTFGNRPLVQSIAIMSLPLAYFLRWWSHQKFIWKIIGSLLILFFVVQNLGQTYQFYAGILPKKLINFTYYKKVYGTTVKDNSNTILINIPEGLDYKNYFHWSPVWHLDSDMIVVPFSSDYSHDGKEFAVLLTSNSDSLSQILSRQKLIKIKIVASYFMDNYNQYNAPSLILEISNNGSDNIWKSMNIPDAMNDRDLDTLNFSVGLPQLSEKAILKLYVLNHSTDSVVIRYTDLSIHD